MKRIFYLDFLKGVAIFFVVLLHTAALGLSRAEIGTFTWEVCNVIDSLCRFVVPIFVMISGALLLDEKKSFYLQKSLKRLFIPLIMWSMLYALLVIAYQIRTVSFDSFTAFLKLSFITPTHNWFLFMLIGVYIMIPLLKPIIRNGGGKMLVILWIVFGVLNPFCKNLDILTTFSNYISRFSITLPLGYIGYFVLGYELSRVNRSIDKICLTFLVFLSIVIIICNALLTHYVSASQGCLTEIYYDYISPMVVIYSACLFLIFKRLFANNDYYNHQCYSKYIVLMSKYSLAIYMCHEFILIPIQKFGINPTISNPIISVPSIALGIYTITFILIHTLAKVSFFRKTMM